MSIKIPVLFLTAIFLITGCKTQPSYKEPKPIDLVAITKGSWLACNASEKLITKAKDILPADSVILSTSLSNIDNLNTTSTLGRVLSEQLSSRLSDQGYHLKEIKMRSNVFISQEKGGEFTLSRRIAVLSKSHEANAILAGTYAVGSKTVYVNARLIDTSNSLVLSTVDFQLPLDADMRTLIQNDVARKSLDRPKDGIITRTFPPRPVD